MRLWDTRPMPVWERRALTGVAVLAWTLALGVNVGHVADHLRQLRFGVWLAVMPDFFLLLGVWKLRYRPKAVVAWISLAIGLSWLVWAALSTTAADSSHRIVALAPIGGAVVATLLLEFGESRPAPDATPTVEGRVPAPARPARPRPPRARPVPIPEPTVPTLLPAELPTMNVVQGSGKRPAPSRERAAEILADLDLDDVSAAQLHRKHGGSDRWWIDRKREESDRRVTAELARLGSGLSVE